MGLSKLRRIFRRKPPIWETSEWENMSWSEKMAIWKRHRRYSFILALLFTISFVASLAWYTKRYLSGTATITDLILSIAIVVVMGLCLYLAQNLID